MSKIGVTLDGHTYQIEVDLHRMVDSSLTVKVDGETVNVTMPNLDSSKQMEWILVDNRPYEIVLDRDLQWIKAYSGLHHLEIRDLEANVPRPLSGDGRVKAPIPGLITKVLVEKGQTVKVGQPLLVLEAMKMENEILAPRSGTINHLNIKPGQSVILQEVLVEIN